MHHPQAPLVKDLLLIGGGHAHVVALKRFAMNPLPGLRITLITRDIHTPYSGMLPGYIAGFYGYDACHIDLGPLARMANARLIHASAHRLDPEQQLVFCDDRPPLHYDLLSINTGSTPDHSQIEGVDEYALAVKPIDVLLQRWTELKHTITHDDSDRTWHIVVVGGGAGGVEMALATQYRLQQELNSSGGNPSRLDFARTLANRSPITTFLVNLVVARFRMRVAVPSDLAVSRHVISLLSGMTKASVSI